MATAHDIQQLALFHHEPRHLRHRERVRLRAAELRDGVDMWRFAHRHPCNEGLSPFFYVALVRRFGPGCLMAEVAGEPIGFVVARRQGERIHVFDLALVPDADRRDLLRLLGALIVYPGFEGAEVVIPAPSASVLVQRALGDILALARELMPLIERESPSPERLDGYDLEASWDSAS